jgi:hypothetical protein
MALMYVYLAFIGKNRELNFVLGKFDSATSDKLAFMQAAHARVQKTDPTAPRSSRIAIASSVGGVFLQLITESRDEGYPLD